MPASIPKKLAVIVIAAATVGYFAYRWMYRDGSSTWHGEIQEITQEAVTGWVRHRGGGAQIATMRFYLDKTPGSGGTELFFETKADRPVSGGSAERGDGARGFRAALPVQVGDGQQHTLYGYIVVADGLVPLAGSPKEFRSVSRPLGTVKISSPFTGEMVKGNKLRIRYTIEGNSAEISALHWVVDWVLNRATGETDTTEAYDTQLTGVFEMPLVSTGPHTLVVYQILGDTSHHHQTILNSDTSVAFQSR